MVRITKARKSHLPTFALAAGAVGAASCLFLVGWGLRTWGLQTAANLAQLVSIPVALAPGLVVLFLWWRRVVQPTRITAADTTRLREDLAPLVYERWRTESKIRALDDPDPIPVRWRRSDDQRLVDVPSNLTSNVLMVASSADITTLVTDFRRLRRGRLVILGGPGAGKTTLAVQILLELLRDRAEGSTDPVPILLSAASWDPQRYESLWDWVADTIKQDHPELAAAGYGAQAIRAVATQRNVLPVIDGLDEASYQLRPALLEEVHTATTEGSLQVILTSRADEYRAAVEAYGRVLASAVVIQPEPLSADAAADYIERCLPADPGLGWRTILKRLRSAGGPENAAAALSLDPPTRFVMVAVE